jgi:hypothetical protein
MCVLIIIDCGMYCAIMELPVCICIGYYVILIIDGILVFIIHNMMRCDAVVSMM